METVVRKCDVCLANPVKYCCPKCSARTCSLACVKLHKEETDCNGVRNLAAFISKSDFDEFSLLSDYRFLEETGRCVNNATRFPMRRPRNEAHDVRLPYRLHRMVIECRKRGTCLLILPENFQRRKHNTTYYNIKTREFLWNIELDFPQAEAKYVIKNVSDRTKLGQVLEPYLSTESASQDVTGRLCFYQSAGYGGITPLMRVERIRSRVPQYIKLDFSETLLENLVGKTIVEFPTIILVLSEHKFSYAILGDEHQPERNLEEGEIKSSDSALPISTDHTKAPSVSKELLPKTSSPANTVENTVIANSAKLVADYSGSETD